MLLRKRCRTIYFKKKRILKEVLQEQMKKYKETLIEKNPKLKNKIHLDVTNTIQNPL